MFTNNCRDEVTLIFLKHKYRANLTNLRESTSYMIHHAAQVENDAIRRTFAEVRDRNAQGKQAGSYDAVAEQCEEFFQAAEPVQVG